MPVQLDHMILPVNDREKSIDFYTGILGFPYEGESGNFSTLRVTTDLVLLLAPWGTKGGDHLAFAMTHAEFDEAFSRIRDNAIEYGDQFDSVGNMQGPGDEQGAKGMGKSVYFFDPSQHLIEILYYPEA